MSANCIEKNAPKHTKTIRNDHHGAQDAQLAAVKPRRVGDHGAGDGPYLWRRAHKSEFNINTWSDEGIGKKGAAGSGGNLVIQGSCLRNVRPFRCLAMYRSAPTDFAFCIDKALVRAPLRSQDSVILSMHH